MEINFQRRDFERGMPGDGQEGFGQRRKVKVLLREPELCRECGAEYLSLYPIKRCFEHEGLEDF